MACFGSKSLRRKEVNDEETQSRRRRKDGGKKPNKGNASPGGEGSSSKQGGGGKKGEKFRKQRRSSGNDGQPKITKTQLPVKPEITLRKRVDPETMKYFTEIARLFENNEVELDERAAICGNALEETSGKEVELATDAIISHTLQILLEGCDLEQLCVFVRNCAKEFSSIAMDKNGSHVAETALKSLVMHLQDEGSISMVEDTLAKICQMVVGGAANLMCCRYGSHVLRSLLCLCRGVPVDTLEEFHVTKSSAVLSERLNSTSAQPIEQITRKFQHGFPAVFGFLIREMLVHAKDEIKTLRVNKYSTFVLQTALELLVDEDKQLWEVILIILGCEEKDIAEEKSIPAEIKQEIVALLEDTAFSHLFEVIIKVAPMTLYESLLNDVFRGSLFEISSLQCGNFVVQALTSSTKIKDQVNLIWEELGSKLKELLEIGKSGVVASILTACLRHQIHVQECCQALAAAVSTGSESRQCCVPHLLFLESYFRHKSSWTWPAGDKMHTLGCLVLQAIFRCPKKYIQTYITSISSMDADHIFETAKDAGGARVLEAYLSSEAFAKQKNEVISKLQNHFGELAMRPSSSFTVEKCFSVSDVSLKEAIASELLAVHVELSKMKHGPYLLKKLDIDGFSRRPEQWKRSQASKETIYKEFQAAFGSSSEFQDQRKAPPKPTKRRKKGTTSDKIYQDVDVPNSVSSLDLEFPGLETSMAKMGLLGNERGTKRERPADPITSKDTGKSKFLQHGTKVTPFLRNPGKRKYSDLAGGKQEFNSGDAQKPSRSTRNEKKPFLKKPRK